jgi:DNA mismatch endonuclease (patch repair protein)
MTESTSLPELIVRSAISDRFGPFETNQRDLPGTPDIVFRNQKVAVFVHGCFWHRHRDCELATFPDHNIQNWLMTFNTTVRRDTDAIHKLRAMGWKHLVFWECEISTRLQGLILDLELILRR